MEDFPPPDEYKPCQKIYPSKVPRSKYLLYQDPPQYRVPADSTMPLLSASKDAECAQSHNLKEMYLS